MKMQIGLHVNGKFTGGYTNKDGKYVDTYGISTIGEDGRATELQVPVEVYQNVELNKAYVLSGNIGVSRFGQYWNIDGIVKELKPTDKASEK